MNNRKFQISIVILFLLIEHPFLINHINAQDRPPYASDKPLPEPVIFQPGVISNPGVYGSTFTPDGYTIYFTINIDALALHFIMKSKYQNNAWSTPVTAEFSGQYSDGDPFI